MVNVHHRIQVIHFFNTNAHRTQEVQHQVKKTLLKNVVFLLQCEHKFRKKNSLFKQNSSMDLI